MSSIVGCSSCLDPFRECQDSDRSNNILNFPALVKPQSLKVKRQADEHHVETKEEKFKKALGVSDSFYDPNACTVVPAWGSNGRSAHLFMKELPYHIDSDLWMGYTFRRDAFTLLSTYDMRAYLEVSVYKMMIASQPLCPEQCDAAYNRMLKTTGKGQDMAGLITEIISEVSGAVSEISTTVDAQKPDFETFKMLSKTINEVVKAIKKDEKTSHSLGKYIMKLSNMAVKGMDSS